jgi:iron complex outermembrane receptor protein
MNIRVLAAIAALAAPLLFRATAEAQTWQDSAINAPAPGLSALRQLSLEELANIRVITESKQPVKLSRSPAAIYVITGDDIRRSGFTTIVDALRLAPGVEVARISTNEWSVGIRGFGTRLSRSALVLSCGEPPAAHHRFEIASHQLHPFL